MIGVVEVVDTLDDEYNDESPSGYQQQQAEVRMDIYLTDEVCVTLP